MNGVDDAGNERRFVPYNINEADNEGVDGGTVSSPDDGGGLLIAAGVVEAVLGLRSTGPYESPHPA
jgi:hypothetical protein